VTSDLPTKLPPARIIRQTAALRALVDQLRREPLLALDTESNSLYAYYEQVCLVQLSTRTHDYILDPLALDDMSALGEVLSDPAIEKVLHAAEYDVITLKRDFGFEFANLFDTMLAARICGWPKTGLGAILGEQFGVEVEKRYQRADWSRRPLPADQLRYAQMDTHYLPALRDFARAELFARGALDEALETFAELPKLPPAEFSFDPEGYWRIHALRDFSRRQLAVARELYLERDAIARELDWPVFKVFTDATLAALARLAPRSLADLHGLKGLGSRLIQRYGVRLLDAAQRGMQGPLPQPPPRSAPLQPDVRARFQALHEWRKQRAAERGVESDVIIPKETMWALARRVPHSLEALDDIPGLGPWRRQAYGAELIRVLAEAQE